MKFSIKDIDEAFAGDICALFGVDCSTGDTFVTDKDLKLTMVLKKRLKIYFFSNPVIRKFVEAFINFILMDHIKNAPENYKNVSTFFPLKKQKFKNAPTVFPLKKYKNPHKT